MPCPSTGRPNTAFSAQAGRIQFDSRFVIPTFINGVSVTTLRDSGHSGTLYASGGQRAEPGIISLSGTGDTGTRAMHGGQSSHPHPPDTVALPPVPAPHPPT